MPCKFMTEKETEALLELQTRDLSWPDGTKRPFTMTKWYWNSFDFLVLCTSLTAERLVELALLDCKSMNRKFEDSFPNLLAYAHQGARRRGD